MAENAKKPPAPASPPDPWLAAVERYRESARWAIGAFGAIGVLLAGTAPLAELGVVQSDQRNVLAGSLLGLVGVGLAIGATLYALVPRAVYWHEVQAEEQKPFKRLLTTLGPLENILAKHPESMLPAGIGTLEDFEAAIRNLQALIYELTADAQNATVKKKREEIERARELYLQRLDVYQEVKGRLLLIGRYEKARTAFHRAVLVMLLGSAVAAFGLSQLLLGTQDKNALAQAQANVAKTEAETKQILAGAAKTRAEIPGQAAPAEPGREPPGPLPEIAVSLTPEGQELLGPVLGEGCDLDAIPALLLGGDAATGSWVVVVLPDPCQSARLELTPELGQPAP